MDRLLRKFAQKYKKAKEEMIVDVENYGVLKNVDGMSKDLPAKQVESLEAIFTALHKTLGDLKKIIGALEKIWSESCQLLKEEKLQVSSIQAQQHFGLGPSLNECIQGLEGLFVMHRDEYHLKVSIVCALSYHSSVPDVAAMQSLLAEQPNIPSDEVRIIFEYFYAGYST